MAFFRRSSKVVPVEEDEEDCDYGDDAVKWNRRWKVTKKDGQALLNGHREIVRVDESCYKITGDYFTDLGFRENEFVVVEVGLTTHPDTVLRESGIIRQTGRIGRIVKAEVIYDPKAKRWVYTSHATTSRLKIEPEQLRARKDTPPSGVVRIVGEIEFSKFQKAPLKNTYVQTKGGGYKQRRQSSAAHNNKVPECATKSRDFKGYEELMDSDEELEVDETTGLGEAGDEDSSFMSDLEVAKHIKQYISRAIPSLVTQSGMVVLHNGVGAIAHQLSKGMAVFESVHVDDEDDDDEHPNDKQHPGACVSIVPVVLRHEVKQHFTHSILLRRDGPKKRNVEEGEVDANNNPDALDTEKKTRQVTKREVIDFINRLVESLSEGYSKTTDLRHLTGQAATRKHPPSRLPVPCCSLLIGGDHTLAPMELMQSVTRRDSIVVIQGSKGYADSLCAIIDAVHDYNSNAGLDDFQRFLGTADALTEQILMTMLTGKLVIIKKGTKVEEFQRRLHACLRGDEALVKAWSKYAQWKENEERQANVFTIFNFLILLVSILATLVSVLLTFLLLIWKQQKKVYPAVWSDRTPIAGEEAPYIVYFTLTWSIIGFPILLALLQAVNNKVNPAAKWVALRLASEDVLRQIYMYRTRTLDYSAEKCKEHDPSSPGYIRPKDGLVYSTREEFLSFRVNLNIDQLSRSPVAGVALSQYKGSLPPKNIRHNDHGFNDLSPDEYIEIRLRTKRQELQKISSKFQFKNNAINIAIHCFSGIGTCLAAVAANGFGYLQAWIAFTTALVNSLQRYSDFSNLGRLHEQYNKTDNNLSNVEIWFAKLGESKDGMQNRNQLVKRTEDFINEEVQTWARLLQSVAERLKEIDDSKDQERIKEIQKGKESQEVKKLQEIGFEGLQPAIVKKAMQDPNSNEGKMMQQALAKLNEDMGDVLKPATKTVEGAMQMAAEEAKEAGEVHMLRAAQEVQTVVTAAKNTLQDAHSVLSSLPAIPKVFSDLVSTHNVTEMVDELLAEGHVNMANVRSVSHQRLAEILEPVPLLGDVLATLSQKDFLECIKGVVLFSVTDQLFNNVPGLTVKVWDVIPSSSEIEDFVNEMYIILVKTEGVRADRPEMVLAQIRDEDIRERLTKLDSVQLKLLFGNLSDVLRSAKDLNDLSFADAEAELGKSKLDIAVLLKLLENCSLQLSELDIEAVMDDVEERIELWKELKDLPKTTATALETMSKHELLKILPSRFRKMMENKSVFQIATSINQLLAGTPASRMFEALTRRSGTRIPELNLPFFQDPVSREKFVIASEILDQKIINKNGKGNLVRMLRVHTSFHSGLAEDLLDLNETAFTQILSGLQALFSNSYSGRVIDRLNDELTSFDIKGLLDIEDREKLTLKLREFRDVQPKLAKMSKTQLLTAIGYPRLQEKLKKLTQDQLIDLVFTLEWIMRNESQMRIWARLVMLPRYRVGTKRASIMLATLPEEAVDRIFNYAAHMDVVTSADNEVSLPELDKYKRDDHSRDLLNHIGDSLLTSYLMNTSPKDIIDVLKMVHRTFGDPLVCEVFETVGSGMKQAGREAQYLKFGHFFLTAFQGISDATGETEEDMWYSENAFHKVAKSKREQLMFGLENICMHEVYDVQHWDPATLRQEMLRNDVSGAITELLTEVGEDGDGNEIDDDELHDITWRLLSELTVSLPYRVFVQVCNTTCDYDVRDLIQQLSSRYYFPLVVITLKQNGLLTFADGKVQHTKKDFFRMLAGLTGFSQMTDELREFTEPQLQQVLNITYHYITSTPGGRFLSAYTKELASRSQMLADDLLKNLGILLFKNKMRTRHGKSKVKQLFCSWNAKEFLSMTSDDKYSQLCQFLEDTDLVELFMTFNAAQLKRVFAHLIPLDNDHQANCNTQDDHTKALLFELEKPAEFSDSEEEDEEEEEGMYSDDDE
eukprot:TRINITY_DN9523_c0_g1_i3.p1 TRINITY_DN9523_c0_g1~~TRINITY_DN9523_c0_g1_i3.p1  ORF type:complete len:1922 (+),score=779.56 TRINITY_DN9523_c0_g1_i3:44-5809(+)